MSSQKDIVRRGYDLVSQAYRADSEDERCVIYHAWLDELISLLHPGAAILDLGCGNGIPVAKLLAESFRLTGVDLSEVQIERAHRNVPRAVFIHEDMTTVEFKPGSFAAVASFYAIIHVPLDEQLPLLKRVYSWLQPGGLLMITVGHEAWTGHEENWLGAGAPMAWSHADEPTYVAWLNAIGFVIRWARLIPEGTTSHTLVLASKGDLQKEAKTHV